jgi:hypothetical protein
VETEEATCEGCACLTDLLILRWGDERCVYLQLPKCQWMDNRRQWMDNLARARSPTGIATAIMGPSWPMLTRTSALPNPPDLIVAEQFITFTQPSSKLSCRNATTASSDQHGPPLTGRNALTGSSTSHMLHW